jgi:hypothetical protein
MGGACSRYGDRRGAYRVAVGKPEGKNLLEDIDVDEGIILNLIFNEWDRETWTGEIWLRIGTDGVLL